jgi:hypothetical protein
MNIKINIHHCLEKLLLDSKSPEFDFASPYLILRDWDVSSNQLLGYSVKIKIDHFLQDIQLIAHFVFPLDPYGKIEAF